MLDFKRKLDEQKNKKVSILISYRQEGKPLGKGAFYDHYTIQRHTHFPTSVVHANIPTISLHHLVSYIQAQTQNLPYSQVNEEIQRPLPAELTQYQDGGLLVIPGMTRDSSDKPDQFHLQRMTFETEIIKDAINRGRPIVALCAGSWKLWQTVGGQLVPVTDHNYGGGMPRIQPSGKIGYNVHIHDIIIEADSLLQKSMTKKGRAVPVRLEVNSIHWNAPSSQNLPTNFQIAARAVRDPNRVLNTRQGTRMMPEEGTVEAFESKFGAPIIGYVWHPEANDWDDATNPHHRTLLYMAKAGNAFQARQNLNKEYKNAVKKVREQDAEDLADVFSKLTLM